MTSSSLSSFSSYFSFLVSITSGDLSKETVFFLWICPQEFSGSAAWSAALRVFSLTSDFLILGSSVFYFFLVMDPSRRLLTTMEPSKLFLDSLLEPYDEKLKSSNSMELSSFLIPSLFLQILLVSCFQEEWALSASCSSVSVSISSLDVGYFSSSLLRLTSPRGTNG